MPCGSSAKSSPAESQGLSPESAQDNGSPERRWTAFGISSSPLPLDELAARDKWARTEGEKVRFINVSLPKSEDGGIFDRLPEGTPDPVEAGKILIKALERGVALHYGHIMPAWIELLLAENHALKIQEYRAHFAAKVAPDGTGYDKNYAEKFGVLYAAGRLAVEGGILPWPKDLPWQVVRLCYHLAVAASVSADVLAAKKIKRLVKLLKQKTRFPKASVAVSKVVAYHADTLGVRIDIKGRSKCAMRKKELSKFAGSPAVAKTMLRKMSAAGALGSGQGTAGTSQPGVKVKVGAKTIKPRFWVIDMKKLRHSIGN